MTVSPWRRIALPRVVREQVHPWSTDTVLSIIQAVDPTYRAAVLLAAGAGLRQGEIFGLDVQDVDFLRRQVLVRQQVKRVNGQAIYGPPKSKRTRRIPLPRLVVEAISLSLREKPASEVTLPWGAPDGPARTHSLIFTGARGAALRRDDFNRRVWHPALRVVGVDPSRTTGMHQLRHYYASLLIDAGESPKVVQDRLGHASIAQTFDVYGHLFPATEDRTREAVDRAFAGPSAQNAGELREGDPR